jgi:hypothetical protein
MSSALAIAAVTAALKALLDDHLARRSVAARVGDVVVTALPPDRLPTGAEERSGLNLFLYHVTPHARLRSPAASEGEGRRAALALDLHYLLAAYGQGDLHAEVLLGCAVQVLLETAVLTPAMLEAAVARATGDGQGALAGDGAEPLGPLEISPEFLSVEETARLWSAFQARYRPCASYKVSSVVIQSGR